MAELNLDAIREKIDGIDSQITDLFLKRMDLCDDVAEYKMQNNLPVLDKGRERAKLSKVLESVPADKATYAMTLFNTLFEVSKAEQACKNATSTNTLEEIDNALSTSEKTLPENPFVACQGLEGAFSQIACDKLFKHANISFFPNFRSVFKAVDEGFCKYGVLPFENSSAGTVNEVYDLIAEYDFHIVATHRLKVTHNLIANKGARLEDITDIYSHQQAIEQCSKYLDGLKNVEIHAVENTAIAAERVRSSNSLTACAIASNNACETYDLVALAKSIEDNKANYTRFACITKDLDILPGANRTSLSIVVNNEPGCLYKVLALFNSLEINLIKLESRPIPNRDFEYMFYFDVDAPVYSESFRKLIKSLNSVCAEYRYLGSYSEIV